MHMMKGDGLLPGSCPAAGASTGSGSCLGKDSRTKWLTFYFSLSERIFPNEYVGSDLVRPTESEQPQPLQSR